MGDTGFVADRKAVKQYREAAHELLREIEAARSENSDVGFIIDPRRNAPTKNFEYRISCMSL